MDFQNISLLISIKIKKKKIEKNLELHMSYFDIDTNSPGSLSTKLSIDSNQLDSLILYLLEVFYYALVLLYYHLYLELFMI